MQIRGSGDFPLEGFQNQEEGKRLPQEQSCIQPMEGFAVFQAYCAACHGRDAKGRGPAAGSLKTTCVGGLPVPEKLRGIFSEGACVVAAHQFLRLTDL